MAVSASEQATQLIISQDGAKGLPGDNGTDGSGFNNVRKSKIDSPLLQILKTNDLASVSAPLNTNADVTWSRATAATYIDIYGDLQTAGIDEPREEMDGFLIEGTSTNLFLNSAVGVTQSVAINNSSVYTASFITGAGSITLSDGGSGVVASGSSVTFTSTSTNVTMTVSGQADNVQLEELPFKSSYIVTAGSSVTRLADSVTVAVNNNIGLLSQDHSVTYNFSTLGNIGDRQYLFSVNNDSVFDRAHVLFSDNNVMLDYSNTNATNVTVGAYDNKHNMVATFDSALELITYHDGVLVTQSTIASAETVKPLTFNLGGKSTAGQELYGYINDFRVYDFILNQDEVTYLSGV